MSDTPPPQRTSALPGLAIIGLFLTALVGLFRANAAPDGSLSGPFYLLTAALSFAYLVHFCFDSK